MKNLLILGCSATKRANPEPLAAVERYDGPLYRVLRGWMARTPDHGQRLAVAILSAQYGLIGAGMRIPLYGRHITFTRAMELRPAVRQDLYELSPGPFASVYISMGAQYRAILPDALPWPAQFASGGIGTRQRELKAWLGGLS